MYFDLTLDVVENVGGTLTPVPVADMADKLEWIKLVVNSTSIIHINVQDLIAMNTNVKVPMAAGLLPLHLEQFWARESAGRDMTALNINSEWCTDATLSVKIKSGVNLASLNVRTNRTAARRDFTFFPTHTRIDAFQHEQTGAGQGILSAFPRGEIKLNRIAIATDQIGDVELRIGGIPWFEESARMRAVNIEREGRQAVAGYTFLNLCTNNRSAEALSLSRMNVIELRADFLATGSFRVIHETQYVGGV